jgi:hypothetical protein
MPSRSSDIGVAVRLQTWLAVEAFDLAVYAIIAQ